MLKRGFTLVELLIVIGLLGAIALIVIAAINPIEQTNRARDARFRADGGQLVSAIDRYFAAKSEFPWVTQTPASYTTESSFGFVTAKDVEVGICGDASCSTAGNLISSDELKTEFMSRDFIKNSSTVDKQILLGKDAGSSSSVYACFIPLSKTNKEKSCADSKVYTLGSDGTRSAVAPAACDGQTETWVTNLWYVCIPE